MKKTLLLAAVAAVTSMASAFAADVTVTLPGGSVGSGTTWTSSTSPAVKLTLDGGTFGIWGTESNIMVSTDGATRTLTIESADPNFWVSSFSFSARGYMGDVVTVVYGDQTVATNDVNTIVSATGLQQGDVVSMTLTPQVAEAKKIVFDDFTVTLSCEGELPEPEPEPEPQPGDLTALDRSNWVVTGCGQRGSAGDTDGGFAQLMDDNVNTFWHSEWGADKAIPHFFVVDLGENHENYGAFGYLPRQNIVGANGYVTAYRLYLVDNIDGLTVAAPSATGTFASGSHQSIEEFVADLTPAAQGTFDITTADLDSRYLRQVTFDETNSQTARYVIFVIDDTANVEAGNKHANCAEFYVYSVFVENIDYTTGLEGSNSNHDSRHTSGLTLTDGTNTLVISDLQTSARSALVWDKSDNVFTTAAGKTITVTPDAFGEWMHQYIFADLNRNGFQYTDDSDYMDGNKLKDGVDLLYFSCYSSDDNTWVNSKGETLSGSYGKLTNEFSFTIPANTPNGTYRVRYKVDWNSLNPNGQTASNNHIANNGGVIVDFSIKVDNSIPNPKEYQAEAEFVCDWSDVMENTPIAAKGLRITVPENVRPTGNGTITVNATDWYDFINPGISQEYTADDLTLEADGTYLLTLSEPITANPNSSQTLVEVTATCTDDFFAAYASADATEPTIDIVKPFEISDYIFYNYQIGEGDFEISVTPESGIITDFTTITITLPESEWVKVNENIDTKVVLTHEGAEVASWTANEVYNAENFGKYVLHLENIAAGDYQLTIPAELFFGDLGYSLAKTMEWTVVGNVNYTAELTVVGAENKVAPRIHMLTLTSAEGTMSVNGEITIQNINGVTVATLGADATSFNEETSLVEVTLESPIVEPGFYTIKVPEGFVNFSTDIVCSISSPIEELYEVVAGPESTVPMALTVTPAEGNVGNTIDIAISFDHEDGYKLPVVLNTVAPADLAVTLTKGTNTLFSHNAEAMAAYAGQIDDEGVMVEYFIIPAYELTELGTYTLTIPEGFFAIPDVNGHNAATTVNWVLDQSGLSNVTVTVDGKEVRYDMLGRPAAAGARGVLIVNGKKIMVK